MTTTLFKIATSTASYTPLKTLLPTAKEPDWSYSPYSREDVLGDGSVRGSGYPIAEWHFGYLTLAEYNALKAYCSGKSASVYMVTRTNGATSTLGYGTYGAVMIWPTNVRFQNMKAIDVTVNFTHLEVV